MHLRRHALRTILGIWALTILALSTATPAAAPAEGEETLTDIKLPKPSDDRRPKSYPPGVKLEKPATQPFVPPPGTVNLAKGRPVTSSDTEPPIVGRLEMITDGDKEGIEGNWVELAPGLQWVQIDLGSPCEIGAVRIWHHYADPRVYHAVIVQVSDDARFKQNVRTILNTDRDNRSGLGVGKDLDHWETGAGKTIQVEGITGRYVRLYSKGNTTDDQNHYTEVEVWGVPGKETDKKASPAASAPRQGTHGHYAALTADWHAPAPFQSVDILYGPRELAGGVECIWWQLEVRKEAAAQKPPLFTLRALTWQDPLSVGGPGRFERYILRLPGSERPLEYRNVHTGKALLPAWRDFQRYFIPRTAKGSGRQGNMPETLSYLGHTLTLLWAGHDVPWQPWDSIKRLDLDRELLVGTGRNFRDAELKRLPQTPQRQNYNYVRFTREEYTPMIAAGINLFIVDPEQSTWIHDQPVFHLRDTGGNPALQYPADLYRSNYVGPVMFMDEPAIIMVGDKLIHNTLRYFSDAANVLMQRVQSRYHSGGHYSAFYLETALKQAGINFGEMRLEQCDYPAWETLYPTAYYQLAAGLAGIVHEGRYRLDEFDAAVAPWTDKPRHHSPEEMLRYHYAFLRGAARATGKHWGTSIYGQADAKHSPLAVTLAYDLGARYVWFWTSDHDHHLPWPEQLALAKVLKDHATRHPRRSIYEPVPTLDTAIVIPYGYFLELGNLWWVRAMDKEGKNEHAQRFARVMRRTHAAIHQAMDRKEDFDIVVNGGQAIGGYRNIVRISEETEQ